MWKTWFYFVALEIYFHYGKKNNNIVLNKNKLFSNVN